MKKISHNYSPVMVTIIHNNHSLHIKFNINLRSHHGQQRTIIQINGGVCLLEIEQSSALHYHQQLDWIIKKKFTHKKILNASLRRDLEVDNTGWLLELKKFFDHKRDEMR